jgi:folate-binding protein YgfZ
MHDLASTAERTLRDYRALREAAAILDLEDWTALRIEGADTAAFLNGTASQEILPTARGPARETLFLTEKGRPVALAWVALEPHGRPAWIFADPGAAPSLRQHLERLRVMEEVEISDAAAGGRRLMGAAGPARAELASSYAARERGVEIFAADPITFILLEAGDRGSSARDPSKLPVESASSAAFEAWRIAAGLPRAGIDFSSERIATELSRPTAISLTKGCYVGQEVVARTSGRGQVRRERVGFRFRWQGAPIAPRSELRAGGIPSGYVTSSIAEPGSSDGLGMGYLSSEALRQQVSILAIEGERTTHIQVAPWPL